MTPHTHPVCYSRLQKAVSNTEAGDLEEHKPEVTWPESGAGLANPSGPQVPLFAKSPGGTGCLSTE